MVGWKYTLSPPADHSRADRKVLRTQARRGRNVEAFMILGE